MKIKYPQKVLNELVHIAHELLQQGDDSLLNHITTAMQITESELSNG